MIFDSLLVKFVVILQVLVSSENHSTNILHGLSIFHSYLDNWEHLVNKSLSYENFIDNFNERLIHINNYTSIPKNIQKIGKSQRNLALKRGNWWKILADLAITHWLEMRQFGTQKRSDYFFKENDRRMIVAQPNELNDLSEVYSKSRLLNPLNLFTILRFENNPCYVDSPVFGIRNGTCFHESECRQLGGFAMGVCAASFGVCCVFQYTCGQQTSRPSVYFVNPQYPQASFNKLNCIFLIEKSRFNIVQIRIDFEMFELLPPTNGTCSDDKFIISGQNTNNIIPILCGINNGQHLYLDVNESSDEPIMITIITNSEQNRIFRLLISQISQSERLNYQPNCLQIFESETGMIESFNYQTGGTIVLQNLPGYLSNLNYAICIRKLDGYCTVTYRNMYEHEIYPFQLTNLDQDGSYLFPPDQAGVEIFNCPDDYIIINGIRLCGDRFNDGTVIADFQQNAPVTDNSAGPFILPVRTNQITNGRGFKLFFQQNKCLSF